MRLTPAYKPPEHIVTLCLWLLLAIVSASAFVILCIVYSTKVAQDDVNENVFNIKRGAWRPGECMYTNRIITSSVCYDKRCLCRSVNETVTVTCDVLLANRTEGLCNNGWTCCIEGRGGHCDLDVGNQRCNVYRGSCSTMSHVFTLSYGPESWARTDTFRCKTNAVCDSEWESDYPLNVSLPCKFKSDDLDPLFRVVVGETVPAAYIRSSYTAYFIAGSIFLVITLSVCILCGIRVFKVKVYAVMHDSSSSSSTSESVASDSGKLPPTYDHAVKFNGLVPLEFQ